MSVDDEAFDEKTSTHHFIDDVAVLNADNGQSSDEILFATIELAITFACSAADAHDDTRLNVIELFKEFCECFGINFLGQTRLIDTVLSLANNHEFAETVLHECIVPKERAEVHERFRRFLALMENDGWLVDDEPPPTLH